MDYSHQSQAEKEVRVALVRYKEALINAHYRNWFHRLSCWLGNNVARQAEADLVHTETAVKAVVNSSHKHQRMARSIAMQQPEPVRERDQFLLLVG